MRLSTSIPAFEAAGASQAKVKIAYSPAGRCGWNLRHAEPDGDACVMVEMTLG
jgi:hypothetical protein